MKRIAQLMVILLCVSAAAVAQEFRATITGRVTDPSSAVIAEAVVVVTNTDTGVKANTVTEKSGGYTVPFLLPGKYSVKVTAPGFDQYLRDGITVLTAEHVEVDVQLTIGSVNEQVHVTANSSLLETQTAAVGQVLTAEEIEDLPDNGRSPLGLAKTSQGVVPKAKNSVVQTRPFDNSATSDFSIGGGNSQSNEYTLNGVPNNQDSSRVPGFSPNLDAVESIRVDVFQSDASFGDTSGGTVNMNTKAGTNAYHGTLSEFNQFSAINAPQRWFVPAGTVTPATRQNQYGATFGGPVWIPKLFNGHDHLFFFYAYERFKDTVPNANTTTVPTVPERTGDFSALLGISSGYQFYDPYQATLSGTKVNRAPIANNVLSASHISPVAQAYLQYIPKPNLTGGADGQNNYFSNNPTSDDYNSQSGRLDYSINDRNKIFFETHRSEYFRTQSNIFSNIATGASTYNVYQGGLLDYIHTFNATTTLDTRASLTRAYANSTLPSQGLNASTLGFPSYIDSNATEKFMPRIVFSDVSGTVSFAGLSTTPGGLSAFDTYQVFASLTHVSGRHTLKIGPDLRLEKYAKLTPGSSSGSYTFGTTYFGSANASTPAFGSSFASFLYGLPTAGTQTIATPALYNAGYFAGFLQDDWRVLPNLTLNIGLRLEHETPIYTTGNRAVVGFDPTITNSATAGAIAKYTANYNATTFPELPVSAFNPKGGLIYASSNHRGEYITAPMYVSPRIGFSFSPPGLNSKTVIRGGIGIFVNPFNDYNTPQSYGYTATNTLVPTTNNYLTPAATLADPFPASNPIAQPTGSALGINTNLGAGIQFRGPGLKVPYAERWSLDVQQQITKNVMLDIGYLGAHQVHLSYSNSVSSAPILPYLSRSHRADPAIPTGAPCNTTPTGNLSQCTMANPFAGLPNMTGSNNTAATLTKYALLQAYPEYSGVTQALVPGASATFNQLIMRLYMRQTHGLMFNANYEYSRNLITGQLNPGGPLSYQESPSDYPHHFSWTGSYSLPLGHGQKFLSRGHAMDLLVGGFKLNAIYQILSGTPISWGNVDFANGSAGFASNFQRSPRNIMKAFNVDAFYRGTGSGAKGCTSTPVVAATCTDPTDTGQPSSTYNYRTFPQYFFRSDFTNNLDASIIKGIHIGDRFRVEYRFEAFNVLNHTQFGTPSVSPTAAVGFTGAAPTGFGTINSISSVNRVLQQGLRVSF